MSKSGSWINNHLFTYTPYSPYMVANKGNNNKYKNLTTVFIIGRLQKNCYKN